MGTQGSGSGAQFRQWGKVLYCLWNAMCIVRTLGMPQRCPPALPT